MEHDRKKELKKSPPLEIGPNDEAFYDTAWCDWNDMIYYSPAPRFRREKILSWISELSPGSLLDVGCGNGEFLAETRKVCPTMTVAGADISPSVIASNRARIPATEFHVLDLNKGAILKRFDAVVCMEVIEHCEDYRGAIKRLTDMTGKYLLITVPCGPLFEIDKRVGHKKHFTPEEITEALQGDGFEVIKLQKWGFPFFNLYKHAINMTPDKMCKEFLSPKSYTLKQKILASAVYALFKLCLPRWGYQLFIMGSRK